MCQEIIPNIIYAEPDDRASLFLFGWQTVSIRTYDDDEGNELAEVIANTYYLTRHSFPPLMMWCSLGNFQMV